MRPVARLCLAVLATLPPLLAHAQNVARHTVELDAIGETTANLLTGPYTEDGVSYGILHGVNHHQIFGGALVGYSYALSPHLALEVRGGFLFGHQPSITQAGGQQITAHAGLLGTFPIGHSRFALTTRVAPGLASYSNAERSAGFSITPNPDGSITIRITPNYTRITHFSLEETIGVSARLSHRTALHVDLGHETIFEGDRFQGALSFPAFVEDHLRISAGVSRSFGHAFTTQTSTLEPQTKAPANELILSYALQPQVHLNQRTFAADGGVALTGSHYLRPWLALDSSVVFIHGRAAPNYQDGGHELEFFTGVKMGFQRPRYGIFAKLRPGLASFDKTYQSVNVDNTLNYAVSTDFAMDAGAVLEFYPARHLVLRADLGEVFTRYAPVGITFPTYMQPLPTYTLVQPEIDKAAGQFLIGVGWRF